MRALVGVACLLVALQPVQAEPKPSATLLDELAVLATGEPADNKLTADVRAGRTSLAQYVDALLAHPQFAGRVASEIIFNGFGTGSPSQLTSQQFSLHKTPVDAEGRFAYYLRFRKVCAPAEAERVHPWWAPDTEVLICPDSYQPTHRVDAHGSYCGGNNLAPHLSTFCGCGPALITCTRDGGQQEAILASLRKELFDTFAHVVTNDLPIARIFTMNATVRDRGAEIFYRIARYVSGELAEPPTLGPWEGAGKLTPRPEATPGQHAGVLTMPQLLYAGDFARSRMRDFYQIMWCKSVDSVHVEAAQIFALGVTNLREGDGWKKLAALPICTDCHARLDYGMQFINGYPSTQVGFLFHAQTAGVGALYADDIRDRRGEGALTPRGFAELATQQKEFGECMVRDVTEHVFNDSTSPEDRQAVMTSFRATGTLRDMVRVALVRYAERRAKHPDAPLAVGTPQAGSDELVRLAPALRERLDDTCLGCHAEGGKQRSLEGERLPRPLVGKMLSQVAFGAMPKGSAGISGSLRHQLVTALIDTLFAEPRDRDQARRYFDQTTRALPLHRGSAVLKLGAAAAGAPPPTELEWGVEPDRADLSTYSVRVATQVGLWGMQVCREAHVGAAELARCLKRAADPRRLLKRGAVP